MRLSDDVLLEGLELTDADRDVDAVRVFRRGPVPDVDALHGQALLPLADFNSAGSAGRPGRQRLALRGRRARALRQAPSANKLSRPLRGGRRPATSSRSRSLMGSPASASTGRRRSAERYLAQRVAHDLQRRLYALFEQLAAAGEARAGLEYGWPYSAFAGLLAPSVVVASCLSRRRRTKR